MTTIQSTESTLSVLLNRDDPRKNDIEVVQGKSYSAINLLRNIVHIPTKLFFWNSSIASGNVSKETIKKVTDCLKYYSLEDDVAVQVDDYSPLWYGSRVFSNPKSSLFSKIILGPPAFIGNLLGLQKLFGSDSYDVLSNSIYLSSDDADIGLYDAGNASYFNSLNWPVFSKYLLPNIAEFCLPLSGTVIQYFQNEQSLKNAQIATDYKQTPTENARSYTVMSSLAYLPTVTAVATSIIVSISAAYMLMGQNRLDDELMPLETLMMRLGAISAISLATTTALGHMFIRMQANQLAAHHEKVQQRIENNKKPL